MEAVTKVSYWALSSVALACFLAVSIAPTAAASGRMRRWFRGGPRAFAAWLGLTLFLFRAPAFFCAGPLNVDESQLIAGALTLLHDPIAWRSFDGQTAGPLDYYVLIPLGCMDGLNYFGLRLLGCGIIFGTLWLSYRALRSVWGEQIARLGILPAFCFFAFATRPDFMHHATELLSLFLLAIAIGGVLRAMANQASFRPRMVAWVMAGLALGALPFAKLQGVPQGGVIMVGAVLWAATRSGWSSQRRVGAVAVLLAALCAVPLLFALLLSLVGGWENFWTSYILATFDYGQKGWHGLGAAMEAGWAILTLSTPFTVFFFGTLGATVLLLSLRLRGLTRFRPKWPLGLLASFMLASLWVAFSGRTALHYLFFTVLPVSMLPAGVLGEGWREQPDTAPANSRRGGLLLASVLGFTVLPMIAIAAVIGNGYLSKIESAPWRRLGAVAREILRHSEPNDCLAVWGYSPELYVETKLRQGTSAANNWSEQARGPYRDYFRRRYLRDLERNRPKVFVDSDQFTRRHENWPELRDYIGRHYALTVELDSARVYVRKRPDVP